MGILYSILIGLLVGAIAKFVMPGKDPGGCFITIAIGLVGSVIGGYLGQVFGWYREGEPVGFIASVVGAMILLGLYRLVAKPRA